VLQYHRSNTYMAENLNNFRVNPGYPVPAFGRDLLGNLPMNLSLVHTSSLGQTPPQQDQRRMLAELPVETVGALQPSTEIL
jgi:hypothetical protein